MNWKARHFSLNLNPQKTMPDDPESTLFNLETNPAAYPPEEPKEEPKAEEVSEPEPEGNPS